MNARSMLPPARVGRKMSAIRSQDDSWPRAVFSKSIENRLSEGGRVSSPTTLNPSSKGNRLVPRLPETPVTSNDGFVEAIIFSGWQVDSAPMDWTRLQPQSCRASEAQAVIAAELLPVRPPLRSPHQNRHRCNQPYLPAESFAAHLRCVAA